MVKFEKRMECVSSNQFASKSELKHAYAIAQICFIVWFKQIYTIKTTIPSHFYTLK